MDRGSEPSSKAVVLRARIIVAIAAVLLVGGGVWLVMHLLNSEPDSFEVPSTDTPPANVKVKARIHHPLGSVRVTIPLASLPWRRSIHTPEAAYLPLAFLPWDDESQTLPIAPIHRETPDWQHPLPAFIPLATLPWRRSLEQPMPAYVALAALPREFGVTQAPVPTAKEIAAMQAANTQILKQQAAIQTEQKKAQEQKNEQAKAIIAVDRTQRRLKNIEIYEQTHLPKFVMSLCRDLDGNLWVGAEDDPEEAGEFGSLNTGGVWRYDVRKQWWTHFTTKDGLGDDNGYAVACDRKGRVWAGHLNHGVSVFNDGRWRNYGVMDGPLGERIYRIVVSPLNGDVWIASSWGLARHVEADDSWAFYTRYEGLPSEQATAIIFDTSGKIYVGTDCDGIAVAGPEDNYRNWITLNGPRNQDPAAIGRSFPYALINDLTVTSDGTLWAATTSGMSWSTDGGSSWQYARETGHEGKASPLDEDYCTCIIEAPTGDLFIGHRHSKVDVVQRNSTAKHFAYNRLPSAYVTAAIALPNGCLIFGTYGQGVKFISLNESDKVALPRLEETVRRTFLPARSSLPGNSNLPAIPVDIQEHLSNAVGVYAGEDWSTEGDWVGRYGRSAATLCAMESPFDEVSRTVNGCTISADIDPSTGYHDTIRRWIHWRRKDDVRVLYDPHFGYRRQAEWDDHGEVYSTSENGPGLQVQVSVPTGKFRMSIYFFNKDGHNTPNSLRDFPMELFVEDIAGKESPLARCRIHDFWGGEYKQFIVNGPNKFSIYIHRNHSLNALCSGVFLDDISGKADSVHPGPLALMGETAYFVPGPATIARLTRADDDISRATSLWNCADGYMIDGRWCAFQRECRVSAYRMAGEPAEHRRFSAACRWRLFLFTEDDRAYFDFVMHQGWLSYCKLNHMAPNISEDRR